jgi:hypothetical protein
MGKAPRSLVGGVRSWHASLPSFASVGYAILKDISDHICLWRASLPFSASVGYAILKDILHEVGYAILKDISDHIL